MFLYFSFLGRVFLLETFLHSLASLTPLCQLLSHTILTEMSGDQADGCRHTCCLRLQGLPPGQRLGCLWEKIRIANSGTPSPEGTFRYTTPCQYLVCACVRARAGDQNGIFSKTLGTIFLKDLKLFDLQTPQNLGLASSR